MGGRRKVCSVQYSASTAARRTCHVMAGREGGRGAHAGVMPAAAADDGTNDELIKYDRGRAQGFEVCLLAL